MSHTTRKPPRRPRFRPRLEALEDRTVPSAFHWIATGGGNWSDPANWALDARTPGTTNLFPNHAGDVATLGNAIKAPSTILVDVNATVGVLNIDSGFAYDLVSAPTNPPTTFPAFTLFFTGSSGLSAINVTTFNGAGAHRIELPVSLTNPLDVNIAGGGSLAVSGRVGDGELPKALTKDGDGLLTLTGTNTYRGGTTLNGGTVRVNTEASLGAVAGAATINNATLEVTASFASLRPYTLGQAGSTIFVDGAASLSVEQPLTGPGSLNKAGPGNLSLDATNTYGGATNLLDGGTILVGVNTIPDASPVTVGVPATLALVAHNEVIGSLAGGGTVTLGSDGTPTLVTGGNNASTLFGGTLQGPGSLFKAGSGIMTLTGFNPFTGQTLVGAGTLLVNGTDPNSAVTVGTGAVLRGTGGTVGPVTASGGTVSPGPRVRPGGPGLLTAQGTVSFAAGSTFRVGLDGLTPGAGYDQLHVTGPPVHLGGSNLIVVPGFVPPSFAGFTILKNDGGPVDGTFNGLPEGAVFMVGTECYQITYRGGGGADVVLTHVSKNEFFVLALYRDVLERSADVGGLVVWVRALDSGAMSRFDVATAIRTSAERRGLEVDLFYQKMLGRAADPGGRAFWVDALVHGAREADVVVDFVTSAEYAALHPDNASFIENIYQAALERSATAAEVNGWDQQLTQGVVSRAQVVQLVLSSAEDVRLAIRENYHAFLRRDPDPAGQQGFTDLIGRGLVSSTSLSAIILASDEYFGLADTCPPAPAPVPPAQPPLQPPGQ